MASARGLPSLRAALSAVAARPLDHLYSRLAALNGSYFPAGWGDLRVVQWEQDLECITAWPPKDLQARDAACRGAAVQ